MNRYMRILVWENSRRLNELHEFAKDLVTYSNNVTYSRMGGGVTEKPDAVKARIHLNKRLDEVRKIVAAAGLNTSYTWSPPPINGGYQRDIDLFLNLFNLAQFQIGFDTVGDLLARAHGVYERNHRAALLRTFNPLTYLGFLVEWIASLPFRLLSRAGFNVARAEQSLLGRATKFLIEILVVLASVATVLEFIGWTDRVRLLLAPYLK
jgi:hypothetical protein